MEEKEKIFIAQALELFMKYGIKAFTMDDLARQLGRSKKTIYTKVKDKNELIEKVLRFQFENERSCIEGICSQGLNAIDETFEIGQFISEMLKKMHPSIHYDLQKYHTDVFQASIKEREEEIYNCTLSNLKKGIQEGLYRYDLNAEVIAKIYMSKIDIVFNPDIFPPSVISFGEVYAILFRYHVLGVASPKGVKYLNKKLKSLKSTST